MNTRLALFVWAAVPLALAGAPACQQKSPSGHGHTDAAAKPAEHDEHAHDQHAHEKHADDGHDHDEHADELRISSEAIERYGIRVEPAAKHALAPTLVAPARVAFNPEEMAHVGSPLRGRVSRLAARLGDTVNKGDPLLVIESPELGEAQSDFLQKRAAALAAAPAVDLAKNAYDRAAALYDKSQGIALTEVQKREADYRAMQAALVTAQTAATGAENRLHLYGMNQREIEALVASGSVNPRFTISAPIAGQVLEREVTLGELVSPERDALLIVANLDTLWVLADVPETRLSEISVGAAAAVTLAASGDPLKGAVAFIAPAVDPATRTAQVRIEVRPGAAALRPGMFARVELQTTAPAGGAPVLAIPDQAVQTVEGGPAVFVPVEGEENTFAKRPVTIGRAVGGMVPVLSGLDEGERYVASGSFLLKAELGKGSATHEH